MKTVKYKRQVFTVPDWAKFIAADADGDVYVFIDMPKAIGVKTVWIGHEIYEFVGNIGKKRNRVYKVKEIK